MPGIVTTPKSNNTAPIGWTDQPAPSQRPHTPVEECAIKWRGALEHGDREAVLNVLSNDWRDVFFEESVSAEIGAAVAAAIGEACDLWIRDGHSPYELVDALRHLVGPDQAKACFSELGTDHFGGFQRLVEQILVANGENERAIPLLENVFRTLPATVSASLDAQFALYVSRKISTGSEIEVLHRCDDAISCITDPAVKAVVMLDLLEHALRAEHVGSKGPCVNLALGLGSLAPQLTQTQLITCSRRIFELLERYSQASVREDSIRWALFEACGEALAFCEGHAAAVPGFIPALLGEIGRTKADWELISFALGLTENQDVRVNTALHHYLAQLAEKPPTANEMAVMSFYVAPDDTDHFANLEQGTVIPYPAWLIDLRGKLRGIWVSAPAQPNPELEALVSAGLATGMPNSQSPNARSEYALDCQTIPMLQKLIIESAGPTVGSDDLDWLAHQLSELERQQ